MAVKPEDRDAYEQGLEDRKTYDSLLGGLLEPFLELPTAALPDSEREAYNKGRNGETLDDDKGGSKDEGDCFLTSACVRAMGFSDDCDELATLRRFRDDYMLVFDEGKADVREYYRKAPGILKVISARPDALMILRRIYDEVVVPCVRLIKQGEPELARLKYKQAVAALAE